MGNKLQLTTSTMPPITQYLNQRNIIWWISLLGAILQCLPLFLNTSDANFNETPISKAIHESEKLKMVHVVSLAICLPISLDVFLDTISHNKYLDWEYRPVFLLSTAFPSLMFITFRNSMTPLKYLAIYHFGFIAFESIVHSFLMTINPNRSKTLILTISHAVYVFCYAIKTLSVISYNAWIDSARILSLIGVLGTVVVTTFYGIITLQSTLGVRSWRQLSWLHFSDEEFIISFYIILFIILTILIQSTRLHYGISGGFRNLNEDYFVTVQTYFILFSVFVIVIPGRLARIKAEKSTLTLRTKGTFVRYVSHEIRSPLNVVYVGLEIILKDLKEAKLNKNIIELVSDVYSSAQSAIQLLNDLLHYESMETDTFTLDLSWRSLLNLSKLKLQSFASLASKDNIKFSIEDSIGICGVDSDDTKSKRKSRQLFFNSEILPGYTIAEICAYVDVNRVDQVIRNLISNALKFTPADGTITVCTRISPCFNAQTTTDRTVLSHEMIDLDSPNQQLFSKTSSKFSCLAVVGKLVIEVSDTGVGIASENKSKMFGEFIQFDRNKLQSGNGSGLGLWISRRIAEYHHGMLSVHSDGVGRGATFSFELPLFRTPEGFLLNAETSEFETVESISDQISTTLSSTNSSQATRRYPLRSRRQVGSQNSNGGKSGSQSPGHQKNRNVICRAVSTNESVSDNKMVFRFLVVDDSSVNRKILTRILQSESARFPTVIIDEANDGDVAITMVTEAIQAKVPYIAILMDSLMNKLNGLGAALFIRNELKYEGVIITVTGNAVQDDIKDLLKAGVDEVLIKPITRAAVLDVLSLRLRERGL